MTRPTVLLSVRIATDESRRAWSPDELITKRHALECVQEPPPIVCQHLRILHALLGPILTPAGDVILRGLEGDELVTDALLDKDGAVVLVDDRFFVLLEIVESAPALLMQ